MDKEFIENPVEAYEKLKQECEQLKAELELFKTSNQTTIDQLKAENEELKENLSDLKKDLKFQNDKISELELDLQNANSTIENIDLMRVGEYNALVNDYNKLKQTLAEIKEIAEEKAKVNDWLALDILQKINEVEDENM